MLVSCFDMSAMIGSVIKIVIGLYVGAFTVLLMSSSNPIHALYFFVFSLFVLGMILCSERNGGR